MEETLWTTVETTYQLVQDFFQQQYQQSTLHDTEAHIKMIFIYIHVYDEICAIRMYIYKCTYICYHPAPPQLPPFHWLVIPYASCLNSVHRGLWPPIAGHGTWNHCLSLKHIPCHLHQQVRWQVMTLILPSWNHGADEQCNLIRSHNLI